MTADPPEESSTEEPQPRSVLMVSALQGIFAFVPQEDITAAELAEVMPALMTRSGVMFEQLSEGARRHLQFRLVSKVMGANGKPIRGGPG